MVIFWNKLKYFVEKETNGEEWGGRGKSGAGGEDSVQRNNIKLWFCFFFGLHKPIRMNEIFL